eukprot:CAMPEP_0115884836 /NCGR_PEP_ID=MMETSP0287-20121206/30339_1 /TAXON_ID=412157 /ORGANISM="Chrysochromulina rotalis, Strain UIO044" /LENGTH=169 /DNA_ID=CAMNT_0003341185 /DNA_START=361 /DNA_END=870 /DNA_ORIENTATION=+
MWSSSAFAHHSRTLPSSPHEASQPARVLPAAAADVGRQFTELTSPECAPGCTWINSSAAGASVSTKGGFQTEGGLQKADRIIGGTCRNQPVAAGVGRPADCIDGALMHIRRRGCMHKAAVASQILPEDNGPIIAARDEAAAVREKVSAQTVDLCAVSVEKQRQSSSDAV